jgi:hypothetical protein
MAGCRRCQRGHQKLHPDPACRLPRVGPVLRAGNHAGVRPLAVLVPPLLVRRTPFLRNEGRPRGGLLCLREFEVGAKRRAHRHTRNYRAVSIHRLRVVTLPIARKIASGVAGASSGTGLPGARLWIASAMAAKTEIASISGGSPTAFER